MIELVLATGNSHKLVELRTLLADLPVRILGPDDLPPDQRFAAAEETGSTFRDNADLKAIHAAVATGRFAVADDSGLELDALDGRPGVRSARYAGDGATDADNNAKLIAEVREALLERPTARFRCVVSVSDPDGRVVARGSGACEGVLIEEARGGGGFGYDPHFLVPSLGKTFAEIAPEEKHRISHRARALAQLREHLGPMLEGTA